MISRILAAIVTASLLAAAVTSVAQTTSGDVTFELPLNLTQVSSDIVKVQVACSITSEAIPPNTPTPDGRLIGKLANQIELPVTRGQLVTTARIVIATAGALNDPIGKSATYDCSILGFSQSQQSWNRFEENSGIPAFRLTPTPARLTGSFTW
jgi:hypothetical protein